MPRSIEEPATKAHSICASRGNVRHAMTIAYVSKYPDVACLINELAAEWNKMIFRAK